MLVQTVKVKRKMWHLTEAKEEENVVLIEELKVLKFRKAINLMLSENQAGFRPSWSLTSDQIAIQIA